MRNDVELLRLTCAFGIIWFHSQAPLLRDVAHGSIVVFIILSIFFSGKPTSLSSHLKKKGQRLLVPWVVWSIAYEIARWRKLGSLPSAVSVNAILEGASVHLWYLPFIFLSLVLVNTLGSIKKRILIYLSLTLTIALTYIVGTITTTQEFASIGILLKYLIFSPIVFFGIFIKEAASEFSVEKNLMVVFLFVLIIVAAIPASLAVTYISGILIASILFVRDIFPSRIENIAKFGILAFPIYLSHGFSLRLAAKLSEQEPMQAIIATALSFIFSIFLSRFPKKIRMFFY